MKKTAAAFLASLMCMGCVTAAVSPSFVKPVSAYAITQSQQDFIGNVGNAAKKTYSKYKILPSMTIAQAILESGWGSSTLSKKYYNFFGMKAGSNYSGETVTVQTTEEINGRIVYIKDKFRVYHSFDQGIEGYYQFITGYSRYSNLIGETNYKEACRKIREDGWATDSGYTNKLINLIETYNLTRFDPQGGGGNVTDTYFKACPSSYTSIVDALNSIGVDSSYAYRKKIAEANGITNYSGTAAQNTKLLNLLKQGKLINPDAKTYFKRCSSSYSSIVDALNSIGADSSFNYRKKIAAANNISNYSGTAAQNTQMLNLLKAGQLVKPN
ncbi:MAG: glucosaminidase domain-containing protein [Ruminococcus sp.]|nr:glucosaminidase domain-containing protein [Ruminococcus sp.]